MTAVTYEDVAPDARLFLALVRGREHAPGIPTLEPAIAAAAARTLPRGPLADALRARLSELDAPRESLAAAERLRAAGTVTVVAGQQPVLFGGPHFVVAKALAAVALARRIDAAGTPCVPLFWVASEDHDHAEVDHVDMGVGDGPPVPLTLPLPRDRRMLSHVLVPTEISAVVARLAALLPAGPGRDDALALVSPVPGDSMGTAFARTLVRLCGRFGLVVIEPAVARPFARAVVDHEVAHPGELALAISQVEDAFAARGFARPLALRPRQSLFFVTDRTGRRHAPGPLPGPDDAAGLLAWRRRLDDKPDGISWNVAGRVLAQDVALPVAAQVCGPSELAYCALLGTAHARLGVPAPALVPRPGFTFGTALDPSQERVQSILPYLARAGIGLLDRLLDAADRTGIEHEVISLGDA